MKTFNAIVSKNQSKNIIDVLLVALGLTAVALFFKLHLFLWRLWIVVSGLWVAILVLVGINEEMRTDKAGLLIQWSGYWLMIVIPPLLLLAITVLLAWVIDSLRER